VNASRVPVVRIRCSVEHEPRTTSALARAGFEAERSLTWLVVRDEALAAGGAVPRAAVRERIGQLVGWVLDREGRIDGRGANVEALVKRVLDEGGLSALLRPRPQAALLASARELHEHLMATGAAFVAWPRFVAWFCEPVA